MAIHHHNDELEHSESVSSVLDALYCDEEKWEEEEEEEKEGEGESNVTTNNDNCSVSPLLLLEQDLFWEDQELNSLLSKEKIQQQTLYDDGILKAVMVDPTICAARRDAVEWMLKVNAHYGFSALTATLAVAYFDRFLLSFHFQREKPWMIQLVAVTCISLAAKVEETQVPLLLDLQVQDTKYVFEAKTIQRMELLVLSTLKWRMHPVTPLSFLDHIIRRLGLRTNLHWEFLRLCENLLLSLLLDARFVGRLPSVLATATMMHVIDQIEQSHADGVGYKNLLLGVLKFNKEKVDECYNAILQLRNANNNDNDNDEDEDEDGPHKDAPHCNKKRKYEQRIPGSPSGVIDAAAGFSSDDGSNDSWSVVVASSSSSSSSLCSSPEEPLFKKTRIQGQPNLNLSPLNPVFVGILATSP